MTENVSNPNPECIPNIFPELSALQKVILDDRVLLLMTFRLSPCNFSQKTSLYFTGSSDMC